MGHIRLGAIPKSQPWRSVVAAVMQADGSGTSIGGASATDGDGSAAGDRQTQPSLLSIREIAARTLAAADAGLERAVGDAGLNHTFFLLTQVALASRSADWRERLAALGIAIGPSGSIRDLTNGLQAALDERFLLAGHVTDISEIAQRSAGEALCQLTLDRSETLFGNSGEELRHAVRQLSTKAGFASFGQVFFGRFLTHFLNFYLSRITADQIGGGTVRSLGEISRFNASLAAHCEQSAAIVRDFAGEWYSKTEYERGIDAENVSGFVAVAVRKLRAEIQNQRVGS